MRDSIKCHKNNHRRRLRHCWRILDTSLLVCSPIFTNSDSHRRNWHLPLISVIFYDFLVTEICKNISLHNFRTTTNLFVVKVLKLDCQNAWKWDHLWIFFVTVDSLTANLKKLLLGTLCYNAIEFKIGEWIKWIKWKLNWKLRNVLSWRKQNVLADFSTLKICLRIYFLNEIWAQFYPLR